jgi:hypothetical protein
MVRGTPANPEAVVYQLVPNGSGAPLSLLQVDENVLLFLDENLKPLIGDLYSSYTLSRKDAESKGTGAAREGAAFGLREMPPQTGLDTPGVFEGNTPCGNGAGVVPITPPNAHCEQMVWKLTLNYDGARSTSTTYRLEGAYGMAKQGTRELVDGGTPFVVEGKWMIGQNADTKSEAVIYQLNPDVPEATISFLRINDNLLLLMDRAGELMVGNGGWGYTLQRTE